MSHFTETSYLINKEFLETNYPQGRAFELFR